MKTRIKLLSELINEIMKALFMDQANLRFVEQRAKELGDKGSFEYQKQKSEIEMTINSRLNQIEILKEMYKEEEK